MLSWLCSRTVPRVKDFFPEIVHQPRGTDAVRVSSLGSDGPVALADVFRTASRSAKPTSLVSLRSGALTLLFANQALEAVHAITCEQDYLLWIGGHYLVQAGTERGQDLVSLMIRILSESKHHQAFAKPQTLLVSGPCDMQLHLMPTTVTAESANDAGAPLQVLVIEHVANDLTSLLQRRVLYSHMLLSKADLVMLTICDLHGKAIHQNKAAACYAGNLVLQPAFPTSNSAAEFLAEGLPVQSKNSCNKPHSHKPLYSWPNARDGYLYRLLGHESGLLQEVAQQLEATGRWQAVLRVPVNLQRPGLSQSLGPYSNNISGPADSPSALQLPACHLEMPKPLATCDASQRHNSPSPSSVPPTRSSVQFPSEQQMPSWRSNLANTQAVTAPSQHRLQPRSCELHPTTFPKRISLPSHSGVMHCSSWQAHATGDSSGLAAAPSQPDPGPMHSAPLKQRQPMPPSPSGSHSQFAASPPSGVSGLLLSKMLDPPRGAPERVMALIQGSIAGAGIAIPGVSQRCNSQQLTPDSNLSSPLLRYSMSTSSYDKDGSTTQVPAKRDCVTHHAYMSVGQRASLQSSKGTVCSQVSSREQDNNSQARQSQGSAIPCSGDLSSDHDLVPVLEQASSLQLPGLPSQTPLENACTLPAYVPAAWGQHSIHTIGAETEADFNAVLMATFAQANTSHSFALNATSSLEMQTQKLVRRGSSFDLLKDMPASPEPVVPASTNSTAAPRTARQPCQSPCQAPSQISSAKPPPSHSTLSGMPYSEAVTTQLSGHAEGGLGQRPHAPAAALPHPSAPVPTPSPLPNLAKSSRCLLATHAGRLASGNGSTAVSDAGGAGQRDQTGEESETCWHDVSISLELDPVSGQQVLVLVQTDVTERVGVEVHLAQVSEASLGLLELIFPRHVIEHMTLGPSQHPSRTGVPGSQTGPVTTALQGPGLGGLDFDALASHHDSVTILFCDICGFTAMSKEVEAFQVMRFLNTLYSAYDRLVDKHGVYKLETVGDCYVVVGGLMKVDEQGFATVTHSGSSVAPEVHATATLDFAIDMIHVANTMVMPHDQQPVVVRCGIHSGPITSGVVGSRMPKFCLFGDTMNVASRMESTCAKGCIQVSSDTYKLLANHPQAGQLHHSGGVEVKGKGRMDTYVYTPPWSRTPPWSTPDGSSSSPLTHSPAPDGAATILLPGTAGAVMPGTATANAEASALAVPDCSSPSLLGTAHQAPAAVVAVPGPGPGTSYLMQLERPSLQAGFSSPSSPGSSASRSLINSQGSPAGSLQLRQLAQATPGVTLAQAISFSRQLVRERNSQGGPLLSVCTLLASSSAQQLTTASNNSSSCNKPVSSSLITLSGLVTQDVQARSPILLTSQAPGMVLGDRTDVPSDAAATKPRMPADTDVAEPPSSTQRATSATTKGACTSTAATAQGNAVNTKATRQAAKSESPMDWLLASAHLLGPTGWLDMDSKGERAPVHRAPAVRRQASITAGSWTRPRTAAAAVARAFGATGSTPVVGSSGGDAAVGLPDLLPALLVRPTLQASGRQAAKCNTSTRHTARLQQTQEGRHA